MLWKELKIRTKWMYRHDTASSSLHKIPLLFFEITIRQDQGSMERYQLIAHCSWFITRDNLSRSAAPHGTLVETQFFEYRDVILPIKSTNWLKLICKYFNFRPRLYSRNITKCYHIFDITLAHVCGLTTSEHLTLNEH